MKEVNKNTTINDKEIANAVRQVGKDKEAIKTFKSISELDLRNLLQKERNGKTSKKPIRLALYSISSAAAIVALVFLLNIFHNNPDTSLYQAYFEVPTNDYFDSSERGVSETAQLSPSDQNVITTFFKNYENKKYNDALQLLTSRFDENELQQMPELLFYVSICQLADNKISMAKKNLLFLNDFNPDWQDVNWYLSLTYLKEGKKDDAKTLLAKIKNDGGVHAEKAANLLNEL
ncbi:MAG: hypothetical protein LBO74_04905 [Candidatus Symbiothrix sp.]|jgi:hypothetical protein|nr:hypothetical protein [Candidatus Symbiothrix sp.]